MQERSTCRVLGACSSGHTVLPRTWINSWEYGQGIFPSMLLSGCPSSQPTLGSALCQPPLGHTQSHPCNITPPWGPQAPRGVLAVLTGLPAPLGSQARSWCGMRSSRRIWSCHTAWQAKQGSGEGLRQLTQKNTVEDDIWGQDQVVLTRNWLKIWDENHQA